MLWLAVVGGLAIVLSAGIGIGLIVLNLSGTDSTDATSPGQTPIPTVTVSESITVTPAPAPPTPAPTVTVTQPPPPAPTVTVTQSPPWPAGYWSAGSPCVIPFPGVELGLEYGYTNDPTIKAWVYGVQELIQRLFDRGWSPTSPGPLDGEYGAKTEAGVLGFQRAYQIPDVGRVGSTTWATLRNQCERFR